MSKIGDVFFPGKKNHLVTELSTLVLRLHSSNFVLRSADFGDLRDTLNGDFHISTCSPFACVWTAAARVRLKQTRETCFWTLQQPKTLLKLRSQPPAASSLSLCRLGLERAEIWKLEQQSNCSDLQVYPCAKRWVFGNQRRFEASGDFKTFKNVFPVFVLVGRVLRCSRNKQMVNMLRYGNPRSMCPLDPSLKYEVRRMQS